MVCMVIAFNFVYMERITHFHQHSADQTDLVTALLTHITHLTSGYHKDNLSNITCSPTHDPPLIVSASTQHL